MTIKVSFCRHELGCDKLSTRPQGPFVEKHLSANLLNKPGGPGLGDPRAIYPTLLKLSEDACVARGDDVHVPVVVQRGVTAREKIVPEGDVLRVSGLRRGKLLQVKVSVARQIEVRLDHKGRAAARRTCDDAEDVGAGDGESGQRR